MSKNYYISVSTKVAIPRSRRWRESGYANQTVIVPSQSESKPVEQLWQVQEIGTEEAPQSAIEAEYPIAIPDGGIYAYIDGDSRQYKKLFSIADTGTEEDPEYTLVSELPFGVRKDDEIVILTDVAEKINFINVGTVEEPVWVVDMSPVIIKSAYPEGETAPDPSDNNWYSALKANALFVRKDIDDQINGIITFNNNVKFGNYIAGSSGASVYKDSDNAWHLEADYVHVRRALTAEEIQVQRVSHIGGKVMNTPASMVCSSVTDMGTYYRCYFKQTDGDGREIFNQFVTGDQAYCETFNLEKQEGGTLGNHYYWRLVVGVGENYIDLSKSDCASSSQPPRAGDNIVQLGNRSTESRQSAIIEASAGSGSPFIRVYKGISGYSLPTPRIDINPTLSVFYGQFVNASGTNIETLISNAETLAQGAQTAASSAVSAANTAYNTANSAYSRSSSAISTANSAASTANSAASSAASAITAANNAQNTANGAASAASDAQSAADDALEATETNAAAIYALNGQVTAIAGRFNSQGHLTELSAYMLTDTYATMLTANFNSDGSVKSSSSIVTTSTYAALMSQYLTDNHYINSTAGLVVTSGTGGNAFANMFASNVTSQGIAKTASIQAYVDNKIATITLTADKIVFDGYQVDVNGTLATGKEIGSENPVGSFISGELYYSIKVASHYNTSQGKTVYSGINFNDLLYIGNVTRPSYSSENEKESVIQSTEVVNIFSSKGIYLLPGLMSGNKTNNCVSIQGGLSIWTRTYSGSTTLSPSDTVFVQTSGSETNVYLPNADIVTPGEVHIIRRQSAAITVRCRSVNVNTSTTSEAIGNLYTNGQLVTSFSIGYEASGRKYGSCMFVCTGVTEKYYSGQYYKVAEWIVISLGDLVI